MNNVYRLLRRLDLNLLVVFDAMMRERSVSRAAQLCFLSQPAMSNALNRLREMLDDPLFIRTSSGMLPSPRAKALEGPIHSMLNQLSSQLQPTETFNPATTERHFCIALTSYGENLLLPQISQILSEQAPKAQLEISRLSEGFPLEELERGDIDLVIGVQAYLPPLKQLKSRPYLNERLVCLARKKRRRSKRLSLKQFLAHRHIYPSPLGVKTNIVDSWLEQQGVKRDIAISTHSYLVAARVAAETDYLLSLPYQIARQLSQLLPLDILEPPAEFPMFQLSMIWHPLYGQEPATRWLLEVVTNINP
ncbi:MAG: LysR substrate-binding domain-containing protein [Sedimenticola sp.]|nr:LysR substrate-binding domain-containing protein [Sedimenticola sp.]